MQNATRIYSLEQSLADLVEERQRLRTDGAETADLERNRREIVARQQELSNALIAQSARPVAFAAA